MNKVSGGEPYGKSNTLPVFDVEYGITKKNRATNVKAMQKIK